MVDGELDPDSIRQVTVHADACGPCGAFREQARAQLLAHRALAAGALTRAASREPVAPPPERWGTSDRGVTDPALPRIAPDWRH